MSDSMWFWAFVMFIAVGFSLRQMAFKARDAVTSEKAQDFLATFLKKMLTGK